MGSLRKKTSTRALPSNAELSSKNGTEQAAWVDGRGKKRTAKTTIGRDGATRIVVECGNWLAKYRDGDGIVREVSTGCRDKQAAKAKLHDLERRAELVRSRVLTKAEDSAADHATVPLQQHFDAYRAYRVTQELNETRIKNTDARLKRLADECDFRFLPDLSAEKLTRWLGTELKAGTGAGTRNEYRQEMNGFANWCVRTGRLTSNPFGDVPRANVKADRRRKRRALAEAELERLVFVARWRPLAEHGRETETMKPKNGAKRKRSNWTKKPLTLDGLEAALAASRKKLARNPKLVAKLECCGRERALIYRTLVLTGLRRGELASVTISSLVLDTATPYMTLEARDEKNRKGSKIPLRADLVVELQSWIAEKREAYAGSDAEFMSEQLFAVPSSLLRVLNRDLAVAGIPKTDERGRSVDVHAMRVTLATMLNAAGVAPRTAQEIMRHSDIRLTMDTYNDPKLLNVGVALESLPKLAPASGGRGSDDESEGQALGEFPPMFPPGAVSQGHFPSSSVDIEGTKQNGHPQAEGHGNPAKPTKKALPEGDSDKAESIGMTGFEPATSASRTQRSSQAELHPVCGGC
jgi:integrase